MTKKNAGNIAYTLFLLALLIWGAFEYRELARAVRDAADRYGMVEHQPRNKP